MHPVRQTFSFSINMKKKKNGMPGDEAGKRVPYDISKVRHIEKIDTIHRILYTSRKFDVSMCRKFRYDIQH